MVHNDNGPAPEKKALGATLYDTLSTHPLILLLGVFVTAVTLTVGVYEWSKPWRLDADYRQLEQRVHESGEASASFTSTPLPELTPPVRISVLGPLTGDNAPYGLAQLRGVVSAAMHATVEFYGRPVEDWQSIFSIQPVNTHLPQFSASTRNDELARLFREAERNSDAVFGPVTSQESVELLITRSEEVRVPTIITTAATPRIRAHQKYGTLLLQLSPNIATYARQYVEYVGEFLEPHPSHILVIARDDEYGRSSVAAITQAAAQHRLSVQSLVYQPQSATQIDPTAYSAQILRDNAGVIEQMRAAPNDWVVMIADVNDMLRDVARGVRQGAPGVRIGTLSSPDIDDVATGDYDGMYVIYSFAPVQYSLNTLAFYQYARSSQPYLNQLIGEGTTQNWPRLDTVDAEVHDAALYWIERFVVGRTAGMPATASRNLYVTNFAVRGDGPRLGNEGALYLFRVAGRRIVPVEIDLH